MKWFVLLHHSFGVIKNLVFVQIVKLELLYNYEEVY